MSGNNRLGNTHGYDAIFLNGTVGVGKSTVADAISEADAISKASTIAHAVIDLDAIRRLSPAPEDDLFNHELELANLHSLAANYRQAGAVRFIMAGVIEDPAEVSRYVEALGAREMFICRLIAAREVVAERLVQRHYGDPKSLAWHLARRDELDQILSANAVEDLLLDSTFIEPHDVAVRVRHAAGWE